MGPRQARDENWQKTEFKAAQMKSFALISVTSGHKPLALDFLRQK